MTTLVRGAYAQLYSKCFYLFMMRNTSRMFLYCTVQQMFLTERKTALPARLKPRREANSGQGPARIPPVRSPTAAVRRGALRPPAAISALSLPACLPPRHHFRGGRRHLGCGHRARRGAAETPRRPGSSPFPLPFPDMAPPASAPGSGRGACALRRGGPIVRR